MRKLRCLIVASCAAFFAISHVLTAQAVQRAADLRGTWELVSLKDLKTGAVNPLNRTEWMQFTSSHWAVISMDKGRKLVTPAQYDSLSAEDKVKADYARVFDGAGGQVFAARAGTWKLAGDQLHQTASMAIYAPLIGVDRILKIINLGKTRLVLQAPNVGSTDLVAELTYRRID